MSSEAGEGCVVGEMEVHCLTCIASTTVNETIIFVAISWRLLSFIAGEEGWRAWMLYFLGKQDLPIVSKAILQSGQQYYLQVSLTTPVSLSLTDSCKAHDHSKYRGDGCDALSLSPTIHRLVAYDAIYRATECDGLQSLSRPQTWLT